MGEQISRKLDITGERYGRLTPLYAAGKVGAASIWVCRCDCGRTAIVRLGNIRNGHTQSCGCFEIESRNSPNTKPLKHGHCRRVDGRRTRTPTYMSWKCMWDRCTEPGNASYPSYGAKGVTVCSRWEDFAAFLTDMGLRPERHTLDRIDPFGNYEPSNCRWADSRTQGSNRRKNYVRS